MTLRRSIFLAALALAGPLTPIAHAQPAAPRPDAAVVRTTLDNAEREHRENYQASKFAEAIAAARGGLALAEQAGTLTDQVQFIRHLAYDYLLMGDNDSALDYSQRLLECADTLNDNRIRAQSHRYLSQIYDSMEDDARSRSHAESALRFARLAGDEDVRIYALTVVGQSEARARHFDAALRVFEEAHAYWEKHNRPWNAVNSLVNIAGVVDARGDLPDALKRYEEILAARVANKDLSGQVQAVSAIASLLRRLGRADEALPRLAATRALAESIGGHRLLAEFYGNLAQVQEARHDFAAALTAERLAAAEREQLSGERARLRAGELETRLNLAEKQQAIDRLIREMSRREAEFRAQETKRTYAAELRLGIFGGLFLAGVFVVIIVVQHFQLRSARRATAAVPSGPAAGS